MSKMVMVLGLFLALRGAAAAAVVTSPSDAAVTVVASASIGSDRTILAHDGNWVSSAFAAADGLYELTLNSATFASGPNCVANVQTAAIPAHANVVTSGAPDFLYVWTWKKGIQTPEPLDLICGGDGPKPAPCIGTPLP